MATFREMVYMTLDILKERSDDSFYTEEHILFLLSKMRALIIQRKIKGSRNQAFEALSDDNMQQICLTLEPDALTPDGCSGLWLKSTEKIPELVEGTTPKVYVVNDLLHSTVTYIPSERMPYVGHNPWLKNIIYVSKSVDDYLYLNSANPQFTYLESVKLSGIFADPIEAAKMSCDGESSETPCDPLDNAFPLDDALIPMCIEMTVSELAGPRYAPDDTRNNAHDDLSSIAAARTRAESPSAGMSNEILKEDKKQ